MYRFDSYHRLEPSRRSSSLERGFRAEVHDPLWFVARQWQLGEHQGEDASSPVWVETYVESVNIGPLAAAPTLDPTQIPPEAIVESEHGDWWTPGRRIRLGAEVSASRGLPDLDAAKPEWLLDELPGVYARFDKKGYDGRALHAAFPDHPAFAEVPIEPRDHWDDEHLLYSANFPCDNGSLTLEAHRGGHIDWYSLDAQGNPLGKGTRHKVGRIPSSLRYPGSPHPRWWQIEDAKVDIGGMAPDRGHFATLLLIDLVVSHSDDWFTYPLEGKAGSILNITKARVRDSFDEWWNLNPPRDWSLFKVEGLPETSLLLWPTVTAPLTGVVLDEVIMGIDEQSNLLWAVEQRTGGRDTAPSDAQSVSGHDGLLEGAQTYTYLSDVGARSHWHPYTMDTVDIHGYPQRRLIQGRLADLTDEPASLFPAPVTHLLKPQASSPPRIAPEAVPWNGLRLQRRWMLVRSTLGQPQLWIQRQRLPLVHTPASLLRHDVLAPGQ